MKLIMKSLEVQKIADHEGIVLKRLKSYLTGILAIRQQAMLSDGRATSSRESERDAMLDSVRDPRLDIELASLADERKQLEAERAQLEAEKAKKGLFRWI